MLEAPTGADDVDPEPTDAQWERLSVVPERRSMFAYDMYFRECWADAAATWGERVMAVASSVAVLMLKPDAVVGRRAGPVLDFVAGHGLRPVACRTTRLTRHSMRELYRYDWHIYPVDRLAFSTFWYTTDDVVAFVLEDVAPERGLPASVRLSGLKGSTPEARQPWHLRSVLAPPNRILNFVHVTDEPADLFREIGILLDRDDRRALLTEVAASLGSDRGADVRRDVAALEARVPAHDLDLERSLRRLAAVPAVGPGPVDEVAAGLAAGRSFAWDELRALLHPDAPGVDRWDFICVASHAIEAERDVPAEMLPPVNRAAWAERELAR